MPNDIQKAGGEAAVIPAGTSDQTLVSLLAEVKQTDDPKEIARLSRQIEQVIFHKQFQNA